MKKYNILLALILAAALTGCAKGETSSGNTSETLTESSSQSTSDNGGAPPFTPSAPESVSSADSADSEPQTSEPAETSEPAADPDATFLVGLAGDTILRSELSMIFTGDGTDGSPETFSEDTFSGVLCDGFIYLAEPSGVCRTNYDNGDVFDGGMVRFTDVSGALRSDYSRVEVGETFGGLTLTEAQVNFAHGLDGTEYILGDGSTKLGGELGFPEIYFMGGMAAFDGKVTMNGYISVTAEDERGLFAGDIIFVPSGCECTLPVMGYRFDPDAGFVHYPLMNSRGGMYWVNDYGYISLGNAENVAADLSGLPDDGSFAKVSVTLDNIRMTCGINMMESYSAEIADIEVW